MGNIIAEAEAVIATVETIVTAIIKVAPLVEQGIADAKPYVEALVGLIKGNNVTQDQLDQAVASVLALSAEFQKPLPDEPPAST